MRNKLLITGALAAVVMLVACSDSVKRDPGTVYMPDMAYSRALETYAPNAYLKEEGINYDATPVAGTVSRSQDYVYHIAMDKVGDTANYFASSAVPSPVQMLTEKEMEETKRLYMINCGICHGTKLDGNGPLWKDGTGPYPAAPKSLIGDELMAMSEGKMFYSITYGKNLMGSYASQVTPKQRWDIIHYIKVQQGKKTNGTATVKEDAVADSTKVAMK